MEARPPLLAHRRRARLRRQRPNRPGGRRRPAPLHTPAAARRPDPLPAQNAPESRSGPGSRCHRPTRAQRPPWLDRRKLPKQPWKLALAAAQARCLHGACAQGARLRSPVTWRAGAEPRLVAGGWGRKSEVSADVRVESGRSGRLGAEVRLGSLSAIVDPRSGEREGKTSVQAEETGPFHRLPSARPSFWLLSERRLRRRLEQSTRLRAASNCCECTGRGPGGSGGGGSSRVAVKNVSH